MNAYECKGKDFEVRGAGQMKREQPFDCSRYFSYPWEPLYPR